MSLSYSVSGPLAAKIGSAGFLIPDPKIVTGGTPILPEHGVTASSYLSGDVYSKQGPG
jgi:hypothetical protein